MKEKARKEGELRELAMKARMERGGAPAGGGLAARMDAGGACNGVCAVRFGMCAVRHERRCS